MDHLTRAQERARLSADLKVRGVVGPSVKMQVPDGAEGTVRGISHRFGVDSRVGFFTWHRLMPGCFDESIAAQDSVPTFWQHSWAWSEQPPIGHSIDLDVVDSDHTVDGDDDLPARALQVTSQLYLGHDVPDRVWLAADAGALREWSIGYRIQEYRILEEDDRDVWIIEKGDLEENSIVLRGANTGTGTDAVQKSPGGLDPADLPQLMALLRDQYDLDVIAKGALDDVLAEGVELIRNDSGGLDVVRRPDPADPSAVQQVDLSDLDPTTARRLLLAQR